MGFSAKPIVIVGVKASEVVSLENKSESFDKHDERGNKTGETGTDTKIVLSATVEGEKVTSSNKKVYSDSVSSLLDLPDIYSSRDKENGTLGVFTANGYGDEEDIDSNIIGIVALQVDVMTSEIDSVEGVSVDSMQTIVRQKIKGKFGVDVKPQLFLYGNGSC